MVVLTGGIASGKTAVSDHFARLGVPIIDTDVIARELVAPGQPAMKHILEEFGPEFLDSSGHLDRKKMRRTIFRNAALRARLESILHPLIATEAQRRMTSLDAPYCILVVPLYAESIRRPVVDHVVVVDVDEETQLRRLMIRDGIDQQQARAMLKAQSSRQDRLALADDIISNRGSLHDLEAEVEILHERILAKINK